MTNSDLSMTKVQELMEETRNSICDNTTGKDSDLGIIKCFNGRASREITVHYSETESDTYKLCNKCSNQLIVDAKIHEITLTIKEIG